MLPTPLAREVIEATGQPECMRHPMARSGDIIKEYMEPVPLATMPPLSRRLCRGISFGRIESVDPPREVPPCPECGRESWDEVRSEHSRLVYSCDEADRMRSLAVVAMYEPFVAFPRFDRTQRIFKDETQWLPAFLFNHAATAVLIKGAVSERHEPHVNMMPVYVE